MEPLGRYATQSAAWLAQECLVTERTARRWKASGMAPRLALAWLTLRDLGDLGAIRPEWAGWRLWRDGLLYDSATGGGSGFRPGEIRAMPLRMALIRSLKQELDQFRSNSATTGGLAATLAPSGFRRLAALHKSA